jgi:hypothetical protein
MPVHVREIRIDAVETLASKDAAASLKIHGVLTDRRPRNMPDWIEHDGDVIHHMEVTLTVAWPDLLITAIVGTMRTVPHPEVCPDAVPPLQSLVGVAVGRGFTRAVNERIGRERGCTHVAALIQAMGPVVRQGAGAAFGFVKPGSGAMPWFINSCQAWREGGPLHRQFGETPAAEAPPED